MNESSDSTRESQLADSAVLPGTEVTSYAVAVGDLRVMIEQAMGELDMDDSNSVLFFGTAAQSAVTTVADEMLDGVRNKDSGPAGQALNEMVATLRGFSLDELSAARPGLLTRLLGRAKPIAKVLQRYEEIRSQIDSISNRLDAHTSTLMRDIGMLDRLYEKTIAYFRTLAVYIAAGEETLRRLDAETLPSFLHEAEHSGDLMKAQALRDLRARRNDLERRVHDLRLTRQVTMQSLPSIRLVQENDKALVAKIGSTLANTLPLWRQQLALAVTIARSAESGETLQKATDLTNELLTANADSLRQSTQQIRSQIERGVVDIEAVKRANEALIGTIDDTLRIAEEGKRQRTLAETELLACEAALRQSLIAARARTPDPGPAVEA